jgi:hypothetical protein
MNFFKNRSHGMSQAESSRVMNTAGPIFRQPLRVICVANTMQLEDLINLVLERPALYDPSDRKHRDREVSRLFGKKLLLN